MPPNRMDNCSPPFDGHYHEPTFEPTVISMIHLSPAQAARMALSPIHINDYPYLLHLSPAQAATRALSRLSINEDQPRHVVDLVYNTFLPSQTQQLPFQEGVTKVVCLTHMLQGSHHLLEHDEFYDRFVDKVKDQAWEFGHLVKLVIPRPNVDPAGVGKVFLQYACLGGANVCKIMMDRRCWNGDKQIVARFYPEDKFAAGDYASGQ
ncbi:splicing factor U2af large subunit B-like isoform X2 [Lolium rigidum]|uniref:splicing factor U2af large subunit B-like isoform X2 n=1 Tax=Lolium rigidum TaxID=89674 RepID=UPI001F5D76AC|nr:splicing factor U2af large subunit B-like isoform X2 [Lolium rigidum]